MPAKHCAREGCPGVVAPPRQRTSPYCCEICEQVARKMAEELRYLRRYADSGRDLSKRQRAWAELVAVADAVSNWRAVL